MMWRFLSGTIHYFCSLLKTCPHSFCTRVFFESELPSLSLLLQRSVCLSLCLYAFHYTLLRRRNLRGKVSPKDAVNVFISLYIRTPYGLVPVLLVAIAKHPLTSVDLLHVPSFEMQHVSAWTGLRPAVTCCAGWLQSWEIGGAQSCLPAGWGLLVFDPVSLGMWFPKFRRYSLSIETSRPNHRTTRHITEDVNSFIAHCCAPCSWYRPAEASGDCRGSG